MSGWKIMSILQVMKGKGLTSVSTNGTRNLQEISIRYHGQLSFLNDRVLLYNFFNGAFVNERNEKFAYFVIRDSQLWCGKQNPGTFWRDQHETWASLKSYLEASSSGSFDVPTQYKEGWFSG
ncbi:hypothetical protein UY3_12366 [Chelonia mydas]|uniref:Uncharacterized protein n=1 Tax=Chelonia mydas TaxID=8469 RepID=M7BQT0_CHEMY|nr:hypothetical protein UY3_12366 [Chelonia mydas]